jgi:SAM-dependent methyltransferase
MGFKAYNELAWVDEILGTKESYQEEANVYIQEILKVLDKEDISMLHLGCGAGGHDYHFKQVFKVTGVDISPGMLERAILLNPEVDYLLKDMRDFKIEKKYDVVIIPDSIAYMTSLEDLRKTISNANQHLMPGGLLIIVANIKEDFKENNFVYTGKKDDTHITLFENNHQISSSNYEATLFYLIRQGNKKRVYQETHLLGLFTRLEWINIFDEYSFMVNELDMNHLYNQYLLEDSDYFLKVFILQKI